MAEVLLFHHALGQTRGFDSFAEELRAAGHVVHTPDLYEGKTFSDINEGVAHAQEIGFPNLIERGVAAADSLPAGLVYAGFSLGCMPAEKLTITRPGARGALLMSGFADPKYFGVWPDGVSVQIHMMESDPWMRDEDLPPARQFAEDHREAELFLYPGDRHLFAEHGAEYDPVAAALLRQRVLAFLEEVS